MFKDEGSPQFSKVICREERGTLFALLTFLRAEVEVIDRVGTSEPARQTVDLASVRRSSCDRSVDYEGRKGLARELTAVLERARAEVATTEADMPAGDLSRLERDGDRLIEVGFDLARRGARDASFEDISTGTDEWVAVRSLGADLVLLGTLLRDPSTVGDRDTSALLTRAIDAVDQVTAADPAKHWH